MSPAIASMLAASDLRTVRGFRSRRTVGDEERRNGRRATQKRVKAMSKRRGRGRRGAARHINGSSGIAASSLVCMTQVALRLGTSARRPRDACPCTQEAVCCVRRPPDAALPLSAAWPTGRRNRLRSRSFRERRPVSDRRVSEARSDKSPAVPASQQVPRVAGLHAAGCSSTARAWLAQELSEPRSAQAGPHHAPAWAGHQWSPAAPAREGRTLHRASRADPSSTREATARGRHLWGVLGWSSHAA